MSNSTTKSAFQSASHGFSFLLSFQILSKLVTFVANAYLIRNLDFETKGLVFTLELFVMSMLYLAREPFRRSCLRVSLHHYQNESDVTEYKQNLRRVVQIAWLSVPYGLLVCFGGYSLFDWFFANNTKVNQTQYLIFRQSLILHLISCLFGLIGEPFYIVAQNLLLFKIRFRIEGVALVLKVFISIVLVRTVFSEEGNGQGLSLLAFGFSQIVYQAYMALFYVKHFKSNSKVYHLDNGLWDLMPRFSDLRTHFDSTLLKLTGGFWLQTIVKFVLTEGEKYVMILLQSLSDQGVYDLVSQLGSLAARLIFQPIEENSFTIWSKALKNNDQIESTKQVVDSDVRDSAKMLELLVKLFIIIGSCFVFFGPNYSYTLLYILYGERWTSGTEAPRVLSYYCLYVMMMALNGTTEGFVHAASTPKQTQWFNLLMVFFSFAYLGSAVFCLTVLKLGTPSLIIANCINMALRVAFSTWFILTYFRNITKATQNAKKENMTVPAQVFNIGNCIPHALVWLSFSLSFVITHSSARYFEERGWTFRLIHIGIGTICLIVTLFSVRVKERTFLSQVGRLLSGKTH